jgi:hypothetical protein
MRHFATATQSALIASRLLSTNDVRVLTGFLLYLTCIRPSAEPRALWTLTGLAMRIAQRMGLHRDGSTLKLSPFDAEIRRRIWWAIMMFDGVAGEQSGLASITKPLWFDVNLPANLDDKDLSPDMPSLPESRIGATEMMFVRARCSIGDFMRTEGPRLIGANDPKAIDAAIDSLERHFQENFLKYAEPLDPLHLLTTAFARSAVAKMRLMAHYPRSSATYRRKMQGTRSPEEVAKDEAETRDILFQNSLKLIEYHNMAHSFPGIKKFLWHIHVHLQWHSIIYILSALRTGGAAGTNLGGLEPAQRAWDAMSLLFKNRPDVLEARTALTQAVSWLALVAWERWERESGVEEAPPWVAMLRERRAETEAEAAMDEKRREPEDSGTKVSIPTFGNPAEESTGDDTGASRVDPSLSEQQHIGPFDLAMMDLDVKGLDWDEWEQLMEEDATSYQFQPDFSLE